MNIAILGAGAMGCLFAAQLTLSGNQVQLIDVDPTTISAIRDQGITLTLEGSAPQRVCLPIHTADQLQVGFDLVLVLTKGTVTSAAVASVSHLLTPNTRVFSLQNGLGNADLIAQYVDPANVLHGVTTIAADLQKPGEVHGNCQGSIHWWSYCGEESPFMRPLNEVLLKAGFNSYLDDQTESRIWEKVAFNAALNGLCTLLDASVSVVDGHREGQRLIQRIVKECSMVARQLKVAFDQPRVMGNIAHAVAHQGHHLPSMLQDRRACRATEVEAIHGAILRIAEQHCVYTPTIATLYGLLKLGEPPLANHQAAYP